MMTPRTRHRWLAVAVPIAVAAFGIALALFSRRASRSQELMRTVESASSRPFAGRLTGFAYVPRSLRAGASRDLTSLRSVAASIAAETGDEPHLSAIARLLQGKPAEAARALEKLLAREPENALYWNDLAVARLEEATIDEDARASALALAAADRALAIAPQQTEALFNRALALDALGLRFASADAWRSYLTADPSSGWAVEARERLVAAEKPTRDETWKQSALTELERASDDGDTAAIERIVRGFPQHARTTGEATYLPAWGNAFTAGDTKRAAQLLSRARAVGTALSKVNGDRLLLDAVVAIDSGNADVPSIARAYVAYGRGRDDYTARKIGESLVRFAEAERTFSAAGHPMEFLAAYYHANALVDIGEKNAASAIAAELERRLQPSYRSLLAHVLWLRARLSNDAGHYYETLVIATRARQLFGELGEIDYAARLRTGEAAMLARLGRDREAWQSRRATLAEAAESGRWSLVEVAIEAIARDEIEQANADVARSLFGVQVSAPSALPLTRFRGILWRAFLDARATGRRFDTTPVRDAASRIPDPKQQADAVDELRLAEALSVEGSDPSTAERLFTDVIEYRTRAGLLPHLPSIHLHRARARRSLHKPSAEDDLRKAITLIESRREGIRNDTLRDAFLGNSAEAYGELADLLLERGDWQRAFDVSEQARARLLLDRAGRNTQTLEKIVRTTPREVVAAHYSAFASRTLMVVIEHGTATHHVLPVGRSELESLRDQLVTTIQSNNSQEATRRATRLYDLLIAPLASRLAKDRLLLIVPDEASYGIPFAALQDRNGQYLVEQTAIGIAPTAAAIPNTLQALVPNRSKVTIVGDPAFSTSLFPRLDRLPSAARDADAIGVMFAKAETLIGTGATRSAVMRAGRDSDVLHIAAHALSSPRDASLSLIALAPEGDHQGVLYLQDVQSMELRRRPLVVLAGCETGSLGGGRGTIRSLAHAFLAAESRGVLATLWNVEDERASALTASFYGALSDGATIPMALQEAQLAASRSQPLRAWSAFQVYFGVPYSGDDSMESEMNRDTWH